MHWRSLKVTKENIYNTQHRHLSFFRIEMMDNCGKYLKGNEESEEDEEHRIVENKLSSCTHHTGLSCVGKAVDIL